MRKDIKKIGNSKGITFSKEEAENYDIEIGKYIDITEFKIKKKAKRILND